MIAYRDAKVILTTLPPSSIRQRVWRDELSTAFDALQTSRLIKFLLWTNLGSYRTTHHLLTTISKGFFDGDITQHALMSYQIHEGRIKGTLTLQKKDEHKVSSHTQLPRVTLGI